MNGQVMLNYMFLTVTSTIPVFVSGETCDMHYSRKNDFLIAEEIMRPGNTWGRPWRDMCDPQSISEYSCF